MSEQIQIPEEMEKEFLFDVRRTSMRRSKKERLDRIVWVNPQKYYECPHAKKPDVGRPVSYTHLDVYKRQWHQSGGCVIERKDGTEKKNCKKGGCQVAVCRPLACIMKKFIQNSMIHT